MKNKLEYINFLKGIAILGVVLVHSPQLIIGLNKYIPILLHFGAFGCQLFFVISGFLITKSFENTIKKNDNIWLSLKIFYVKRYIAIAPIYIIFICFYQAVSLLIQYYGLPDFYHFTHNIRSILLNVFLLHGLDLEYINNVIPGGWYIGTQFLFYLIFPPLYLIVIRINSYSKKAIYVLPIAFVILQTLIQFLVYLYSGNWLHMRPSSYMYYYILNQLPCMVVGMILYYMCGLERGVRQSLFFFVLLFATSNILYYGLRLHYWVYCFIPYIVAFSFYYLFLAVKKWYDVNNKHNGIIRFVEWCGEVSFAAYFTNFIGAFILPWAVQIILFKYGVKIDAIVLYLLLFVPIFAVTFGLSPLIDSIIRQIKSIDKWIK